MIHKLYWVQKHFVKNQNGKTIISAGKKVDRAKLTSPIKQDNQKPTQSNVTMNISTIKKDWKYNTRKNLTFYVFRTAWLKCNVESVSKLLLLYFPCSRPVILAQPTTRRSKLETLRNVWNTENKVYCHQLCKRVRLTAPRPHCRKQLKKIRIYCLSSTQNGMSNRIISHSIWAIINRKESLSLQLAKR